MFRMPNRQHGTWRQADDSFGNAPHQKMLEAAATVCSHNDQVDVSVLGVVDNRECWSTRCQKNGLCIQLATILVPDQGFQLSPRCFFHVALHLYEVTDEVSLRTKGRHR